MNTSCLAVCDILDIISQVFLSSFVYTPAYTCSHNSHEYARIHDIVYMVAEQRVLGDTRRVAT